MKKGILVLLFVMMKFFTISNVKPDDTKLLQYPHKTSENIILGYCTAKSVDLLDVKRLFRLYMTGYFS